MATKIEWTDEVWNPITGCTKVSAGCANCYAAALANRFWGARKFTDVRIHPERLQKPMSWLKPRRVFVNSMSDLFHEDVSDEAITGIFAVMAAARERGHQFQILTKRAARMHDYISEMVERFGPMPSNVWLGVSAENQACATARIPLLLETPAPLRFVSFEPLLGPVELAPGWTIDKYVGPRLDWVIVGGESGPDARPMGVEWAELVVTDCQAAGIPVFVKQLGGYPDKRDRPADWPEHLRVREYPDA